MFGAVSRFKSYSQKLKEQVDELFCYLRIWDGLLMKRMCALVESLDTRFPRAQRLSLCRVPSRVVDSKFPLTIVRGSSSLINCLNTHRDDGMTFLVYRPFSPTVLTTCIQQAHQDLFGMIDIVTVIDYLMLRWRSASLKNSLMVGVHFDLLFPQDMCHLMICLPWLNIFWLCGNLSNILCVLLCQRALWRKATPWEFRWRSSVILFL